MDARDLVLATVSLGGVERSDQAEDGASACAAEAFWEVAPGIATQIERLDADVLCVHGLRSPEALLGVFRRANLQRDYQLVFIEDAGWAGAAVAAAVRRSWRVRSRRVHAQAPLMLARAEGQSGYEVAFEPFSQPVLELAVDYVDDNRRALASPPPVRVLCVALGAARGRLERAHPDAGLAAAISAARKASQRLADAAGLRALLLEGMRANPGPVAVLGDFGAGAFSDTLNIVTGAASYRLAVRERAGRQSPQGLFNAALLAGEGGLSGGGLGAALTFESAAVDHILVSDAFHDACAHRQWSIKTFRVFTDHRSAAPGRSAFTDHGWAQAVFDWNPAVD